MTLALISWAVIPFSATQVLADINVGISIFICSFFTWVFMESLWVVGLQIQNILF